MLWRMRRQSKVLTPDRLQEIKARCERATEGPWAVIPNRHKGKDGRPWGKIVAYLRTPTGGTVARNIMTWGDDNGPADAEFSAHAREDVPALVAEVERCWREIEELRKERDLFRDLWSMNCERA